MNEKERLWRALHKEDVDRPPVICPGGMMNGCTTEILIGEEPGYHKDADSMAFVARKVKIQSGFENYGVPFCMTAEAEYLGKVVVDMGSDKTEPRMKEYYTGSLGDLLLELKERRLKGFQRDGRILTVLKAIEKLQNSEIPVIGNLTGPISVGGSILDPLMVLKSIRKSPEQIKGYFQEITEYLLWLGDEMILSGADVIAIADPTATGEILGPVNFETFALPNYRKLIHHFHEKNVPVILHICGDISTIASLLNESGADGISVDSLVNLREIRGKIHGALMGNVSTQVLHQGEPETILRMTKNCLDAGVEILAPACGLSMGTPVKNLRIMTDYGKTGGENGKDHLR